MEKLSKAPSEPQGWTHLAANPAKETDFIRRRGRVKFTSEICLLHQEKVLRPKALSVFTAVSSLTSYSYQHSGVQPGPKEKWSPTSSAATWLTKAFKNQLMK